ncbi:MAG TPA: hypothetical protein DDX72_09130 [Ruminococcaceae bacterium]|nr:hypothetical protein [Oscillospiraceae bacterium]
MDRKTLPYLMPVRSIIFPLIFLVGAGLVNKRIDEISNWWSVTDTIVNLLTIAMLIFAARSTGQTFAELIGYKKGQTKVSQVVIVSVVILVLGMGGMFLAGFLCYGVIPYAPPMVIAPIPVVLAAVNIPLLPITTAFAEDGLYLGCGVNNIKNKYAAVLVPALFYALQHSFIPTLFDVRYILYRFLSFLPLTVILCAYYYKKRDPVPIMIGHTIIDVATVAQIMATSAIPGFYDMMCGMA